MTKYRHPLFTDTHLERMGEIMRAVCRDFGCQLVKSTARPNTSTCSSASPTVTLSRLVNSLEGVTSRRLRQEFPELARHYWRAKRLWSGSYSAGSVGGAPLDVLRAYLEQQNRPRDVVHPGLKAGALPRGAGSG